MRVNAENSRCESKRYVLSRNNRNADQWPKKNTDKHREENYSDKFNVKMVG